LLELLYKYRINFLGLTYKSIQKHLYIAGVVLFVMDELAIEARPTKNIAVAHITMLHSSEFHDKFGIRSACVSH
jgi:hypothetical protein